MMRRLLFLFSSTVLVQSTPPLSFKQFVLVAENDAGEPFGELSILDTRQSQMAEDCPHGVTHTSHIASKTSVTFQWLAPSETGAGCVTFKASVMHRKVWFMDEGNLSTRLCEGEPVTEEEVTPAFECCACSVAEYDFSFYGQWTVQTHPKDYPSGRGNHWSDLIGATHSSGYTMWEDGSYASDGVKQLAQYGSPVSLQKEMRLQGSTIRSVFKHRGLWPAVGNMTNMLMEVDRRRHMVSALTMIGPSPDWLVGISNENLCTADCGWLNPLSLTCCRGMQKCTHQSPGEDAPSDSHLPRQRHEPFLQYHRWELQPMGKIVVRRLSVMEAPCNATYGETGAHDTGDSGETMVKPGMDKHMDTTDMPPKKNMARDCMMMPWSDWSECSVSCGEGVQIRTRTMKRRSKGSGEPCGDRKEMRVCEATAC
ncbi:F-spondin-like protein [Apostichopus japonicus]|uniref:Spondin-1 n=1 Tax=Stichopus japonicus TaxID=307972 RepID=A0A2G8K2B3_STIJA|nr:F-spondin-like protein [Apostichopus japonicus]